MSFQALAFQTAFQQQIFSAGRTIIYLDSTVIPVKDPDYNLLLAFDWNGILEDGVTLSSVTHTVSLPIAGSNQVTHADTGRSDVDISGGVHGALYIIGLAATLSDGGILVRNWPLRVFNS